MALTFRVRIAFTTDPFSASPSWTDVSQYTLTSEDIGATFGQGDLDSAVNPSSASFTWDNHDGRFTVGYTSGAYYPNMLRGRRTHIDVTNNGGSTYHDLFDGYLDTVPLQWSPSGRWAQTQVTCVDLLKVLDRRILTDNIVSIYYNQDSPTDYWDLGDADGTANPRNRTGTTALRTDPTAYSSASAVTWGSGTGVGTDGLPALQVVDSGLLASASPDYQISSGLTFEGFFRADSAVSTDAFTVIETTGWLGTNQYYVALRVMGGVAEAYFTDGTGVPSSVVTGTSSVIDGSTHHLAFTYDLSGVMTLYVDGVSQATLSPGFLTFPGDTYISNVAASTVIHANPPTATFAHIAAYPFAVAAGDILNHALAGLGGFSGDTSAQRFTRIAALAGITPTVTGTSGTQSMGPLSDVEGQSILALLQGVQDTEGGAMYVDPSGTLTLKPRTAFYNQAAVLTLTAGQYDDDLTFVADDSRLINDAVVTSANGTVQEVTNAASITANGTYSVQKTLNTTSDAEALGWAQWQVNVVSSQGMRSPQVTVDLLSNQSLLPTAWSVLPGMRIDVTQLPSGSAPSTSVQLQVAGYSWTYNGGSDTAPGSYRITYNTVPYLTGSIFIFNDATFGKFDGPGVFSY